MERLNWEYIDIDWVGLYNSEQFQQPDTAPSYVLVFSKKIFLSGGGADRETHRFLMSLGYIRVNLRISANFFRVG